ncbi:MAG: T9SS type A sorting domain-containing protein [Reichenbachiella sp.]|uniref:T9SS type A sorting domain-containing protein n=1 Tax=Reichenbachiella sp. TaxID=2184521 RepID=UPI003267CA58
MKRALICISLVLWIMSKSQAQVQVISGSHATVKTTYNAGSGYNRMIVVNVGDECNNCVGTVSSITYGSTALTFQTRRQRGGDIVVETWTLDEAGIVAESGSAAFTVNWSAPPTDELFSVVTLANVDQSDPVPNSRNAAGNSNSLTLGALNAGDNDMVFYVTASRAVTTHTPSTNYTELSEQTSGYTFANAYRVLTTASSETPTSTMSTSNSMVMSGMYFQVTSSPIPAAVDGDWNIGTTWGGACAVGCTEGIDYPGVGWNVEIPGDIDVTVPAGLSVQCNNLILNSDRGTNPASLTLFDNTSDVSVNNNMFVQASGASTATGTTQVNMNGGNINVSSGLTLDASVTSGIISGSLSNSKTSYTPSSGTDRLMVVVVGDENNNNIGTVSSITWGSTALTFQVGEDRGNDIRTEIWTLDEAGITGETGAQDFTVTWSTGPAAEKFSVVTLYNVNQTTPVAATKATGNINSTTVQASPGLSVSANDLYFYTTATRANNRTHTAATGYTESDYQTGNGWSTATAFNQISAAATEQPTATWSSSSNLIIAGMVVQSSGAGSTQQAQILTAGGMLTVGGDITLFSDGNNVEIDLSTSSGSTLVTGGGLVEDGASSTAQIWNVNNNSTIEYSSATAQTIQTTVGNTTITTMGTLTLSGGGAKTLEGNLTVNDALNLDGTATFANGGNTLTYGGTAVLTYSGTAAQVTGPELLSTIEGLSINNSNNVTLNSDVTVNDDISFSDGKLILGSSDVIANTISGYNQDRYFVTDGTGYLQRDLAAAASVDFPVGISTTSLSNLVQLTPGDISTFQVRVGGSFSNAPNDAARVANTEWTINRTAGTAATTVRLSWRDDGTMSFGGSFTPGDTQTEIGRWDGSEWVETSTSSKDATGPDYYFEASGFTTFSPFGVGSGGMSLPVELIRFEANSTLDQVIIAWSTSSEIDNDYFFIERSIDGVNFSAIGTVDGNGTTNTAQNYHFVDSDPFAGLSYYRLVQVDFDGQSETFDPVSVEHRFGSMIQVYPNPIQDRKTRLMLTGINYDQTVNLRLYDLSGLIVFEQQINISDAQSSVILNFPDKIAQGLYQLQINTPNYSEVIKIKVD